MCRCMCAFDVGIVYWNRQETEKEFSNPANVSGVSGWRDIWRKSMDLRRGFETEMIDLDGRCRTISRKGSCFCNG